MKSSAESGTTEQPEPPDRVRVGIAEYAVSTDGTLLSTSGLGSCVGVALFDDLAGIAGLVHVMLPAASDSPGGKPAKFADTGTVTLLEAMEDHGADRKKVFAKIAGGSNMLDIGEPGERISNRNVEAVREALERLDVPIVGEHVGGTHGRSLEVRPSAGDLFIRVVQGEDRTI